MNQKPDNYDVSDRPQQVRSGKRGFSLPSMLSNLPMPPVQPTKDEAEPHKADGESNDEKQHPDKNASID